MSIPSFLKKSTGELTYTEPAMQSTPDEREVRAAEGWEAIKSLVEERNNLRNQFARLEVDYAELHRAFEQTEQKLAFEVSRADHYERFSTEIVTQFNTLRMIVDDVQDRCTKVAFQRVAPSPIKANIDNDMSSEDKVRLEDLAKALAPNTNLPELG